MSRNYQKEMEKMLLGIRGRPRLLLHSCCAPCSTAVLEILASAFSLDVFYYNPNIEPEGEYRKRLGEQERLLAQAEFAQGVGLIPGEYDNALFRTRAAGMERLPEGGARCEACIRMRMEATAREASRRGYAYFTTTLSVSPHKNAELINRLGEELAEVYSVQYLYGDFKKKDGYRRSIQLSKDYSLYRQNYCGCAFGRQKALEEEESPCTFD